MKDLLDNIGFWTIIGVIIGSVFNYLFWILQSKRQEKNENRKMRQEKINEICDFCNILDEKIKILSGVVIAGQTGFFRDNPNFWANVPFFKIELTMQIYFKKCFCEYNELQLAVLDHSASLQKIIDGSYYKILQDGGFSQKIENIIIKRNNFLDSIVKNYLKVVEV